jgi:hypothetical protein
LSTSMRGCPLIPRLQAQAELSVVDGQVALGSSVTASGTNSATSCAMTPKQIYFYSISLVAAVLTGAAYKNEKT